MNIKILDSWLREYLKTDATPQQIAEKLSLTSVSIERMEKYKGDIVYDIEVTTNRPDLMSVIGLARESAAILPYFGIPAQLSNHVVTRLADTTARRGKPTKNNFPLTIINDPNLVNRVCAVVMEVKIKPTPQLIKDRLESSDIRSLNNLIDITNYVMRITGHPTHVMDYDRIKSHTIHIRESKKGEKITTLDSKTYALPGGDIVGDDGKGTIIDLLGVMGLENSVVTDQTKRIIFFINNNDPHRIRRTSMATAIRTEAAIINEKDIDPELAYEALMCGIKLYQELAEGEIISEIIDLYPNKLASKTIIVSEEKINQTIGVKIPLQKSQQILQALDFKVDITADLANLKATVPSWRNRDIDIPEDIIEEIARVYGYHNIPNVLPELQSAMPIRLEHSVLYWEKRIKEAFKYWGFTETYTNPMVSEDMFQGPIENAVAIQNPLTENMSYMRNSLIPSLLQVAQENKSHEEIKIFEIGNIYKQTPQLPDQIPYLSALISKPNLSFFEIKGLLEQLVIDLGIPALNFQLQSDNLTIDISIATKILGHIQFLSDNTIAFELNLQTFFEHATLKKIYTPSSKFPPVIEDLALVAPQEIKTADIISMILKQNPLIKQVTLLDRYQDTRTFHVIYQSHEKNLTIKEIGDIRMKILSTLKTKCNIIQK